VRTRCSRSTSADGGTPVIFLHGGGPGGDSWIDFSPVLEYFTDRRTIFPRPVAVRAGPPRSRSRRMSWAGGYHAKHVVAAMDALGASTRLTSFAALSVALRRWRRRAMYPERVRRVVPQWQPADDGCARCTRGPGGHRYERRWGAYYADWGPNAREKPSTLSAHWSGTTRRRSPTTALKTGLQAA